MFEITINPETVDNYINELLENDQFTEKEREAVQKFLNSDPYTQERDISQALFNNTTHELWKQISKLIDSTVADIIKANKG